MKSDAWRQTRKIEEEYKRSLSKLSSIFKKIAANASEDVYEAKMKEFQESEAYHRFATSAAKRMVTASAKVQADTWRKAAKKSTKSFSFYKLLMAAQKDQLKTSIDSQISRNATIISTLPLDVSRKVVEAVRKSTLEGKRASEIKKLISGYTSQYSKASAKLIARTEVSKTQTALARARAEGTGRKWYVWRTSEDERVRDSHKLMNDIIISWQNPPAPEILNKEPPPTRNTHYHAGEIYNCRCYPEPLLEIDDVKWPHKVYIDGSIRMMRRNEFEEVG